MTQRFVPREGRFAGPPFLMPAIDEREDVEHQNHPPSAVVAQHEQAPQHVLPPIYSAAQTIEPTRLNILALK